LRTFQIPEGPGDAELSRIEPVAIDTYRQDPIAYYTLRYSEVSFVIPRHSHSIVRILPNELICRRKKFPRFENSRRPNRQMRMAFEFKQKFDRSRRSPLSATISIDRSTLLESTGDAAPPT
jgi:hypothetical protein